MFKLQSFYENLNGFAISEVLITLVACATVILLGIGILHHFEDKPVVNVTEHITTEQTNSSSYSILGPATVPPKTAECNEALTYASDGDPGPVQCSNGDLNTAEWDALSALEPSVMRLGYNATATEVQSAICNDANDADSDSSAAISNPIEASVYAISALYYGWHFQSDPSVVLTNGQC